MKLALAEIETAIERLLKEGIADGETLHSRSLQRGGLLRLPLAAGGSAVVKVWRIRDIKEKLKAAVRISNGSREWRMHRLVYQAGIEAPKPLLFRSLVVSAFGPCELMAIEDAGETESGVPYLKRMIAEGREKEITRFEDKMIETTARLLNLKILDVDNQLNNFLVDGGGRVLRIDFECARRRFLFKWRRAELVTMLDRMLRSHLHATHPESERTSRFMHRLAVTLAISGDTRQMTAAITSKKLVHERCKTGITYEINLDW